MNKENYDKIVEEVEQKVKKEIDKKYSPDMLGYINIFEEKKKQILREEYGIDWLTSSERYSANCID